MSLHDCNCGCFCLFVFGNFLRSYVDWFQLSSSLLFFLLLWFVVWYVWLKLLCFCSPEFQENGTATWRLWVSLLSELCHFVFCLLVKTRALGCLLNIHQWEGYTTAEPVKKMSPFADDLFLVNQPFGRFYWQPKWVVTRVPSGVSSFSGTSRGQGSSNCFLFVTSFSGLILLLPRIITWRRWRRRIWFICETCGLSWSLRIVIVKESCWEQVWVLALCGGSSAVACVWRDCFQWCQKCSDVSDASICFSVSPLPYAGVSVVLFICWKPRCRPSLYWFRL